MFPQAEGWTRKAVYNALPNAHYSRWRTITVLIPATKYLAGPHKCISLDKDCLKTPPRITELLLAVPDKRYETSPRAQPAPANRYATHTYAYGYRRVHLGARTDDRRNRQAFDNDLRVLEKSESSARSLNVDGGGMSLCNTPQPPRMAVEHLSALHERLRQAIRLPLLEGGLDIARHVAVERNRHLYVFDVLGWLPTPLALLRKLTLLAVSWLLAGAPWGSIPP